VGNIVWHTRSTACDNTGIICKDPLLKNPSLEHFDPTLLPGSPALDAAVPVHFTASLRLGAMHDIGANQQSISRMLNHRVIRTERQPKRTRSSF
jgi:hypothetical protein